VALFQLLYVVIGLEVPALLMWRGIVRARRDALSRWTILLLTFAELSIWLIASGFMLSLLLATVMGDPAHSTVSARALPEGLIVYGFFPFYLGLGTVLVWFLNKYQV
jgi:hypothetical protein